MMQQENICKSHSRKVEYCSFDSSISENLLCSYCFEKYPNNKEILRIDYIKEQILDQMRQVYYVYLGQLKQLQQKYQVQLTNIQKSLNSLLEKEESIQNIINNIELSQLNNIVQQIQSLFCLKNGYVINNSNDSTEDTQIMISERCKKIQFSNSLKNESILRINNYTVKQRRCTSNSLAVIEPMLDPLEETTIYLKINRFSKSVAIGFCELDIIKNQNFTLTSWDSLAHGCYLLSCGGYTYNSQLAGNNCKKEGFQFQINQIVKIHYDPNIQEAKFELINDSNKQIKMKINAEHVYACVYMSKPDDEIEIVQI